MESENRFWFRFCLVFFVPSSAQGEFGANRLSFSWRPRLLVCNHRGSEERQRWVTAGQPDKASRLASVGHTISPGSDFGSESCRPQISSQSHMQKLDDGSDTLG